MQNDSSEVDNPWKRPGWAESRYHRQRLPALPARPCWSVMVWWEWRRRTLPVALSRSCSQPATDAVLRFRPDRDRSLCRGRVWNAHSYNRQEHPERRQVYGGKGPECARRCRECPCAGSAGRRRLMLIFAGQKDICNEPGGNSVDQPST
jgi:hypothetical protein